jgi:molybdopterin-guanine dinucleotide biosynthesis protein A
MGRDKLLLKVGGVPLIHRVHDVLAGECSEVIVVGHERDGLPPLKARSIEDLRPGREGPLAGMEAGIAASVNRCVFVAAGDMPFLKAEMVRYMLDLIGEGAARAAVPRHHGAHPLCAAYDGRMLSELTAALDSGVRGARRFVERLDGVRYIEGEELERFGEPEILLMNVNSSEDLGRAVALRKHQ